jgi:aspartyl-tRNA(Asn)/glutamyl-tRNA(Gln) amidotransferase subunit C
MPEPFSGAQIEAIAALAQLELTPEEIELFARQLAEFLGYADEVQTVDTTGIPPTASVLLGQATDRADQVQPSLDRDTALAGAPDASLVAGFYKVPRVIG